MQAVRKVVGIIGGHGDRRLDVARFDVHHNSRPLFDVLHRPLRRALDIRVNCERHAAFAFIVVLHDLRRAERKRPARRVERIAQLEAAVVLAQQIVIRHFYAGDAACLFRIEITDDMRRELVVRIPLYRLKHFNTA